MGNAGLDFIRGCTCGCTTLHFNPLERLVRKKRLADELAIYPDGQQTGLILWGLEGEIVMLEVYDAQPGPPTAFQRCLTCVLGKSWDAEIWGGPTKSRGGREPNRHIVGATSNYTNRSGDPFSPWRFSSAGPGRVWIEASPNHIHHLTHARGGEHATLRLDQRLFLQDMNEMSFQIRTFRQSGFS